MELIAHRINTVEALKKTPSHCGVEIDIRSNGNRLHLQHDPFVVGESFEKFLQEYNHGTMILNVKEEGLEEACEKLLARYGVKRYFFLDVSLPFLVWGLRKGRSASAVRFSEYEPLEFADRFAGKLEWVWVDCFSKWPLDDKILENLASKFRVCLVSPELQGHPLDWISDWKQKVNLEHVSAVCTKRADLWEH